MAEGDHFSTSHNLIECSVDQLAFTQDAFGWIMLTSSFASKEKAGKD
jgi:hypothetical protein